MKRYFIVLSVLLFAAGCGHITPAPDQQQQQPKDSSKMIDEAPYTHSGILLDVTGGKDVRGINTGDAASGNAEARLVDGMYELKATIRNVPKPQGDDFYEGWVVRKFPLSVVSTGRLIESPDGYENSFMSPKDLLDHGRYVLTLEPNDGDPAPAAHIVEGDLKEKK